MPHIDDKPLPCGGQAHSQALCDDRPAWAQALSTDAEVGAPPQSCKHQHTVENIGQGCGHRRPCHTQSAAPDMEAQRPQKEHP